MNLREALLEEHSKKQTLKIAAYIGASKKRFGELISLLFSDEKVVTPRAAWAVWHSARIRPKLVLPYLTQMLKNLRNPVHDAVMRNTLGLVQDAEWTEEQMGLAADLCFPLIGDQTQPSAVRAYALTICHRICKQEPELSGELKLILEDCYAGSPAAVQSRANKILKELA